MTLSYFYRVLVAALLVGLGAQQVRVSNGEHTLAQERSARADDNSQRATLALEHAVTIGKLQSQHAADQQQKDTTHAQKLHNIQVAGAADRADAQRLRGNLTTFTSSAVRPGETDTAACQRARDRLPVVGDLLAEGVELEAESRTIIQRRDAEVERLLNQVQIDRKAAGTFAKRDNKDNNEN